MRETNSLPAPVKLFKVEFPLHTFYEGFKLEAVDLMDPRLVSLIL